MNWLKRVRAVLHPISLAVVIVLSSLPGCGDEGDAMKASDGTPKKTPSQVLKEATDKAAATAPPKG